MCDEAMDPGQARRPRPSSKNSQRSGGDILTMRWLHYAVVLAFATGGATVRQEELAVSLECNELWPLLGIEGPKQPPGWYSLLMHYCEKLEGFSPETLPPFELPLDSSLPRKAARLLDEHAPIRECFQAIMEGNGEIFTALFGSSWRAQQNTPRMKLRAAYVCAAAVERELRRSVVGQSETVAVLKRMAFELELRRGIKAPPATVLFLGPPGSGKSLAARRFALALSLCADAGQKEPLHLLEVEMTQHVQWSSSTDLIGDGNKQGSITTFVAQHPNAFILCNEFEKAHRKVLESFLPILDQGFLPMAGGKQVDFRGVVFVFTSNLGEPFWNRPACPEENTLEVDPMDLLSLAETPDERTEWFKTAVPKELLSRLGKGPVVLFRRHQGHHLLEKVDRTCRLNQEVQ